jgi:arabinogalactan oligomer / maltooligosaccharide transport system permease protein
MTEALKSSRGLGATIATLLTALIVVLGGISIFASQAAREADGKARLAGALYQAQSLAALSSAGRNVGGDDAAIAAALEDAMTRAARPGDTYRVVERDGKRLVLSTFPEDQKNGTLPRRLVTAEKPLYDAILALPDVGAASGLDANTARAGVPITVNNARVGYVEVGRKSDAKLAQNWLNPLFLVLLGVATALAFGISYVRPSLRGWAGIGLACATAGLGWAAIDGQSSLLAIDAIKLVTDQATAMSDAAVAAGQAMNWRLGATLGLPDTASAGLTSSTGANSGLQNSIYAIGGLGAVLAAYVGFGGATATGRAFKENPTAYFYVGPALLGMLALAFFPFFYGFMLSFTDTTLLNQGASWGERWVGFDNYATILNDFKFGGTGSAFNYQNFYWTLGVTVLWTVTNVVLGVSIGLALALLLNIKGLKGVAIYRTLLILPWAIPNYITALTWKGMFHPQFGSINQAIQAFGGQPVQWFDSFGPSFITGLATNAWLSFPFMMVVALGALQAVDEDMYEAARIDGASPWQQFWHITLPSLRPALLPAVIVSVVWTFNMFNVIYLVSAGQPSGSTEILVTRAYKIAFEEYRYGYAAAYSVVIFMILLVYGVFQIKATAATEANNK